MTRTKIPCYCGNHNSKVCFAAEKSVYKYSFKLSGIFGTVVKDEDCRRLGIRVESITLFLCILIGFILGLIYCPFVDSYHLDQFPTSEMVGRGRLRNLIVGVFVAIPSGAGVALGVLGKLNLYLPKRYNKRKVPPLVIFINIFINS